MVKKLNVPTNMPLRWELFRGFGKPELLKTAVITLAAVAAAVVFCTVSSLEWDVLAAISGVILCMGLSVAVYTKMENNQSIYLYYKHSADFMRSQQKFIYKSGKEQIYAKKENSGS